MVKPFSKTKKRSPHNTIEELVACNPVAVQQLLHLNDNPRIPKHVFSLPKSVRLAATKLIKLISAFDKLASSHRIKDEASNAYDEKHYRESILRSAEQLLEAFENEGLSRGGFMHWTGDLFLINALGDLHNLGVRPFDSSALLRAKGTMDFFLVDSSPDEQDDPYEIRIQVKIPRDKNAKVGVIVLDGKEYPTGVKACLWIEVLRQKRGMPIGLPNCRSVIKNSKELSGWEDDLHGKPILLLNELHRDIRKLLKKGEGRNSPYRLLL